MDKEDAGEIPVMEPERAVQVTEMIAICSPLNKDKNQAKEVTYGTSNFSTHFRESSRGRD